MMTAGGRAGTAIVSQGIYAVSNLALTVIAAVALTSTDFGWLSMALIAYLVVRGPIVAGCGHAAILREAVGAHRATTTALRCGTVIGAIGLVAAVVLTVPWLAAMSATVPLLIRFEVARVVALGCDRPGLALRGDLIWLVSQVLGTAIVLAAFDEPSIGVVIAPWLAGGVLADLATSGRPRFGARSVAFDRTLAVDDLIGVGLHRLALAAGAVVVSASAAAQVRLAILPFNVAATAATALQPMLLARLRQTGGDRPQMGSVSSRFMVAMTGLITINLAVVLGASAVFGDRWGTNLTAAAALIWWVVLLRFGSAATLVLSSIVKTHPDRRRAALLRPRTVHGLATVALVLTLGTAAGQRGIAIGLSLGAVLGIAIWGHATATLDRGPAGAGSDEPHVRAAAAEAAELA